MWKILQLRLYVEVRKQNQTSSDLKRSGSYNYGKVIKQWNSYWTR